MKIHGKIFPFYYIEAPDHDNGQCILVPMRTKQAGTATNKGTSGVDAILKYTGCLPNNYLTKKEAKQNGWSSSLGNLSDVLPGVQIGGDIYKNRDGKLPSKEGRIWYEADFDYSAGFRNDCRILYSSDGLLFVSYDHYKTFHELV